MHRPATAERVKVPSGSLVSSCATGADAGARLEASVTATSPSAADIGNLEEFTAAQWSCASTQKLAHSLSLQVVKHKIEEVEILCDMSLGKPRPLVPESHRRKIFDTIHNIAHGGIRATRRMIAGRFVWKGLAVDVKAWCQSCLHCARAKVVRQPKTPIQTIPIPQQRFQHLHVDIVGPLEMSKQGHSYLLTVVDRTTRWLEAVPLASITAEKCAEAIVDRWISRFGIPAVVTTDRGRQFTSALWASLCATLGIEHITTTSFHPKSNGMIERTHRQIKDALRARLAGSDWESHLPWVLLGLRAAPKEDTGISSAELVYGAPLRLPGEFTTGLETIDEKFLEKLRNNPPQPVRPLTYEEATAQAPTSALLGAKFILVRKGGSFPPLDPVYAGPYLVLSRGPKFFTIDLGGRQETVSVDRLKPVIGTDQVQPTPPPRRGRPPRVRVTSRVDNGPGG